MIDTHAHLHEIDHVETAIERARAAGVGRIIAVGMEVASNRDTISLSRRFPDIIYPAIGYHPWSITPEGIAENLAFIRDNLAHCLALGEVGLDYQAKVKKVVQQEVFASVLDIASRHNKPVIIHTRFSQHWAHRLAREAGIARAVFHWYSGPLDVLEHILADGYFISATPALSYSPPHQEALKLAPLAQILIETDAPVEYRGKVSEPADLLFTLRELARLKGVEEAEAERVTTENARRCFGIDL